MGNCLEGSNAKNKNTNIYTYTKTNSKNERVSKKEKSVRAANGKEKKSSKILHSVILQSHSTDVYKKYKEIDVIGRGSMGHVAKIVLIDNSVRRIDPSSSGRPSVYALKSIILDRISTTFIEELKNEINILNTMDHPNIVKLHEVISWKKQIYMVQELCDGGDLYTRLPYTEKDSAYITGKLLSAIKYMHDHAIVHRDLKFENIMFENKTPEAEIKVIDFGLSKKFISSKLGIMKEGVGTLYSMAPQVLQGVYTSQADMWAVGVISYMLLSSHRPFYSKKRPVMIDKIMRCDYSFQKNYWDFASQEAKDFIDKLLVLDPKVRYKAMDAQAHAWMHKEFKIEDRAPSVFLTGSVNNILSAYKNSVPLKKLALNVIAHKSTTDEIKNLRKAFDQFDTANNGVISSEEFKVALKDKCSYTDTEIEDMFESIDINNNGHIMYTEFIAATLEAQGEINEDRVAEAFHRLDIDDTGFISKDNMLAMLGDTGVSEQEIEKIISGADTDEVDGQVSYDEFLSLFRNGYGASNSNIMNGLNGFDMSGMISLDETEETNTGTLVGVDAVIPGGRLDPYVVNDPYV